MTINIDSPSRELRKDADGSPRKRRKLGGFDTSDTTAAATSLPRASQSQDSEDPVQAPGDRSSPIAASSTQADENTAPFLTRNIRYHYTSMNRFEPRRIDLNPNSKYCYRHRPDLKCRRQADELTMDKMQQVGHLHQSCFKGNDVGWEEKE